MVFLDARLKMDSALLLKGIDQGLLETAGVAVLGIITSAIKNRVGQSDYLPPAEKKHI